MDIGEARAALMTRGALLTNGLSERGLKAATRGGHLRRVDHGLYVATTVWDAEYSEGRHLLRVVAADARRHGGDTVISHVSAAVAHGYPLFRLDPPCVHTSGPRVDGVVRKSDPFVARHEIAVAEANIVTVGGLRCTSPALTVADVLRTTPPVTALVLMDAAMARVAWDRVARAYDLEAAEDFREEVLHHLRAGARGVRQARRILEFADGRAESPGESVSRWYCAELGIAPPRLQVPIPRLDGGNYYVDFGFDDLAAWGEFDGGGKYTDPQWRGGRSAEQVVIAEKAREDWIRGTTGRRVVRWGSADIASLAAFATRMKAFRLIPG